MADGRYEIAARLFAVRNGAVLKELNADEMKVTCSAEAEMKRSFSCRIRYDAEVDLLTDRLRPVQVIDGREYPLGEFLAATVSMTEQNGCRGWEAECYDQTLLLRQTTAAGRCASRREPLISARSGRCWRNAGLRGSSPSPAP